MGELFGTDGIRGLVNKYPMTPEIAEKVGQATARFLIERHRPRKAVIGRDTRLSGPMFEQSLANGVSTMGVNVDLCGVIPTPAVAFLTHSHGAGAGIVVSASHNPYHDNGIKLFNKDGFKFSDEIENTIEQMVLHSPNNFQNAHRQTGRIDDFIGGISEYQTFLKKIFKTEMPFKNIKMVIDCANGATSSVAQGVFSDLGADVESLFCSPDGTNINEQCGSQFTESLSRKVIENKADIGLAFDGDGDRLIAVSEKGVALTGDQILAICANDMKQDGSLKNNLVVSTVMSNMGLGQALKQMGIRHIKAKVGDRYVVEEMRSKGGVLGGEDSGHTVFLNFHTTGDGILSGMILTHTMVKSDNALSDLSKIMRVFPQVLMNVAVTSKPELSEIPGIMKSIRMVEDRLGEQGRVLVRYSGTEALCRVMVEAQSKDEAAENCQVLAEIISRKLGVK